jgi:flagellar hook-associated protein 3 FlgL
MRLSTAAAYNNGVAQLQQRKSRLDESQEHLNAQLRVLRASDDPVAAARAERARSLVQQSEVQQRAVDASRSAMSQTDSALGSATELLQQARESLISAGNAGYTDANRAGVADTLQGIRAQLLSIANQGDANGNALFGGQSSGSAPFVDGAAGVSFSGTGGEIGTAGEALPLTVDGQATWVGAAEGNGLFKTSTTQSKTAWVDGGRVTDPTTFFTQTSPPNAADPATLKYQVQFSTSGGATTYTVLKDGVAMPSATSVPWTATAATDGQAISLDGMSFAIRGTPQNGDEFQVQLSKPQQNIFATLDQAIKDLRTSNRSSAEVMQTVTQSLVGVDATMSAMSTLRSRVGEALNRADTVEDRAATQGLQAEADRSNAEDLDFVKAFSDFQLQQTGYDAALKTYSMVQKLSLFNYIGG